MSLYERYVLLRLLDLACGVSTISKQRAKVVPHARGRVLEIGVGSGLNLPFYDMQRVQTLIGLDPSPELRRIAERRARNANVELTWLERQAEGIPLADHSVDSIVITYTLCTIGDPGAALSEMHRVLKPDGALYFSEHGRAPDPKVAHVQDALTPYWGKIAGGCTLNRDIPALFGAGRFDVTELQTMYLPKTPRFFGYTYWGCAKPMT